MHKRLLIGIALAVIHCRPAPDPYAAALQRLYAATSDSEVADATEDVVRYRWGWESLPPLTPGSGPGAMNPGDERLVAKLLSMVGRHGRSGYAARLALEWIRPPGDHPELVECAAHGAVGYLECLQLIVAIADPRTLDALVPLLDVDRVPYWVHDPAMSIAFKLVTVGRPGVARLRAAIVEGNEAACSRALIVLSAKLIQPDPDDTEARDLVVSDPGLREAALDAIVVSLQHPAWTCRQRAVVLLGGDRTRWAALEPLRTDPAFPVRDVVDALLREQPESATWVRLGSRGPTLERLMRKGAAHGCWSPDYARVRLAHELATTERYDALYRDFDRAVSKASHPSCRRAAMIIMSNLAPSYLSTIENEPTPRGIPTDVLRDGRDPAEIAITFEDATPVDAGR